MSVKGPFTKGSAIKVILHVLLMYATHLTYFIILKLMALTILNEEQEVYLVNTEF
jgi:hypothetical protein